MAVPCSTQTRAWASSLSEGLTSRPSCTAARRLPHATWQQHAAPQNMRQQGVGKPALHRRREMSRCFSQPDNAPNAPSDAHKTSSSTQSESTGLPQLSSPSLSSSNATAWPPQVPWPASAWTSTFFTALFINLLFGQGGPSLWATARGMTVEQLLTSAELPASVLCLDTAQLLGYALIISRLASKHAPLPQGLLQYKLEGSGTLALAAGAAAAALGISLLLTASTASDPASTQVFAKALAAAGPPGALMLGLSVAVVGPAGEELLYRGLVLPSLTASMPLPAAVAASSLAFGLSHLTPTDLPALTAVGLVFGGACALSRGNLLVPTVAHSMYNAAVLLLAMQAN